MCESTHAIKDTDALQFDTEESGLKAVSEKSEDMLKSGKQNAGRIATERRVINCVKVWRS
jgi:hypothetical protein